MPVFQRACFVIQIKRMRSCIRVTRRLRGVHASRPALSVTGYVPAGRGVNPGQLSGDVIDGLLIQAVADGLKVSSTRVNALSIAFTPRHILNTCDQSPSEEGRRGFGSDRFLPAVCPDCCA